jgi:hypothetical protein
MQFYSARQSEGGFTVTVKVAPSEFSALDVVVDATPIAPEKPYRPLGRSNTKTNAAPGCLISEGRNWLPPAITATGEKDVMDEKAGQIPQESAAPPAQETCSDRKVFSRNAAREFASGRVCLRPLTTLQQRWKITYK